MWPEIVAERDRLGQLLVQAQHLGDRARDLRDLERVRQPRAVVIAGRREEHLRLVLQPAERLAVDDAIAIALKRRPDVVFGLRAQAARASRRSWPPAARGSRARAASSSSRMVIDGMHVAGLQIASIRSACHGHADDLLQEARAVRERADAEDLRQRLAEVGERAARAEVHARPHPCARRRAAARTRASDRCSASSDRCRDRR